jgi:hypothetical protein
MPAAAPERISRAEFSAAVAKKTKRERSLLSLLIVTIAISAWGLGSFAFCARLIKLVEGSGWIEHVVGVGSFVFMMGPILALLYYFERSNRTLDKCPNCRRDVLKGSNSAYILATGKCGWCGHEVLEHEACLEPAITAMPPSVEFKKLSPEDLVTRADAARKRDAWRIVTFTLLYLAGLSPFLWSLYSAAQQSTLPSRQFIALLVAWACLSPMLWIKLSRWLFGADPFPSCPHCHAKWQHSWGHMNVTATGRCGSCGVQVLEERGNVSQASRPTSSGSPAGEVGKADTSMEAKRLSRSQFLACCHAENEAREAIRPTKKRWMIFWFGSTLVVLIGSILFLQPRSLLFVTLGWYFAANIFTETVLKRKKSQKEAPHDSDAKWKTCPFCKNDTTSSSRELIISTGKCKKCLNLILQDDLGQEQNAAH